ncbi:hypothetical protein CL659_00300 [bacterium]|nr:hypothetical protein [bacterium]|tara:strand:- start:50 stop:664 length:615 start_codon:yes stop_codon:yes gene_type:complete
MQVNKTSKVEYLKLITIFFISWGIVELNLPFWLGFLLFFYIFKINIPSMSLAWVAVFMFLRSLQIATQGIFTETPLIHTHMYIALGLLCLYLDASIKKEQKNQWGGLLKSLLGILVATFLLAYIMSDTSIMGFLVALPIASIFISKGWRSYLCCSAFMIYIKTNYITAMLPADERILWLVLVSCLTWGLSELISQINFKKATHP